MFKYEKIGERFVALKMASIEVKKEHEKHKEFEIPGTLCAQREFKNEILSKVLFLKKFHTGSF